MSLHNINNCNNLEKGDLLKDVEIVQPLSKSEATKKKIYETTRMLFSENNYDDVSVDDIVRAAGVSKGLFYVYFESKNSLIASIIDEYVGAIDPDYQKHLDFLPGDMNSREVMLSFVSKIVDTLTNKIGIQGMRTVYRLQLTDAIDMQNVKGYGRGLYTMFENILKVGIEKGEFSTDIPFEELVRHFVMAIRGISYEWCIRYPDFEKHAFTHFTMLLNGIKNSIY